MRHYRERQAVRQQRESLYASHQARLEAQPANQNPHHRRPKGTAQASGFNHPYAQQVPKTSRPRHRGTSAENLLEQGGFLFTLYCWLREAEATYYDCKTTTCCRSSAMSLRCSLSRSIGSTSFAPISDKNAVSSCSL